MNISFFAYIDESEDDRFPYSTVIGVTECIKMGERRTLSADLGNVNIIGLDAITYEDEADLKRQVCVILKELDL